jgi:hypothetical protein
MGARAELRCQFAQMHAAADAAATPFESGQKHLEAPVGANFSM